MFLAMELGLNYHTKTHLVLVLSQALRIIVWCVTRTAKMNHFLSLSKLCLEEQWPVVYV